MSFVNKIMKYEDGAIKGLQGHYQRQASLLKQAGVLTLTGAVNYNKLEELEIYE